MLNVLRWPVRLSTALLIVMIAGWSSFATAQQRTYTLDADFDEGTLVNVNHDTADQLQLDEAAEPFNFIWVAVSSKGTVVKIDTDTGAVVGEFRTTPSSQALGNPSRTTVDNDGSVWVANRNDVYGGLGSVVHIGLLENGQCEDRNDTPGIQTSTAQNDIRGWADTSGPRGVLTADDECIVHYVQVNSRGTRHVSVDVNNDVWVGGLSLPNFDLIKGGRYDVPLSGTIIRSETSVGYGGYGGLIDANGVIWSARRLLRWDTNTPPLNPLNGGIWTGYAHDSYGLCIDSAGNVWNTALYGNIIRKFAPDGSLVGTYSHGSGSAQGCVVDGNGHVWVAHSLLGPSSTVGHILNDGTYIGNVTVGSGPTGVAVDAAGKIWATNYNSRTVSRIDPTAGPIGADGSTPVGAVDFTSGNLGGLLYNYSDMTGSTLTAPPSSGTWTVEYDAGTDRTWSMVSWNDLLPGDDSDISVTAASKPDGGAYGAAIPVTNGAPLVIDDGRFLMVNVTFTRATTDESPILYDLTITANRPPIADANGPYLVGVGGTIPLDGTGSSDPDGDLLTYEWDLDLDGIFGETGTDNGDETGDTPNFTEFDEGAGIITVPLRVTDPFGAFDIDEAMIVIYDPNAGFVTGGGWFYSEPGYCVWNEDCELAEGKANFGFVSKYKKGRSVPEGNTEFQFHAGDLNFHSSAYEWLIITNHKAMYKGVGTINGLGNYGFILTAIDAALTPSTDVDLFRINIWDKDDFDATVYDNQVAAGDEFEDPTMAIDAGNIVIHKGGKARKADDADLADALLEISDDVPAEYELRANYPNPFNPQTTINFGLSETGHVTLTVFDILGRQVSVLIDGVIDAGEHMAVFDARTLPSGTYVYRLETLGGTFTRTMLLVK